MSWLIVREGNIDDSDCEPYYILSEVGEDGIAEIFIQDEPLEKIQRIKSALEWQDALGSGVMSLAQEGITVSPITGKITKKRKPTPKFELVIEKKGKK